MIVKLLTEHHLECLSLKGGCTGSSESTLVKMPHCWKSRVTAQLLFSTYVSNEFERYIRYVTKSYLLEIDVRPKPFCS